MRVRTWSALRGWGLRTSKRLSMLCAIVAVALKLAGILRRMWISETDFKAGFGARVTQRLRLKPCNNCCADRVELAQVLHPAC